MGRNKKHYINLKIKYTKDNMSSVLFLPQFKTDWNPHYLSELKINMILFGITLCIDLWKSNIICELSFLW
jgi:hypothetical protein